MVSTSTQLAFAQVYSPASEPVAVETTERIVRVGSIVDLDGPFRYVGRRLRLGLRAAFAGAEIHGARVELTLRSDGYRPFDSARITNGLLDTGIVAMVGNLGTPTAAATLPLLNATRIPAVGFYTGDDLLRQDQPNVINLRPGFRDEVEALLSSALAGGVAPASICAMIRNDGSSGSLLTAMAGVLDRVAPGSRSAVIVRDMAHRYPVLTTIDAKVARSPVAIYRRDQASVVPIFQHLAAWRGADGERCQVVLFGDGPDRLVRMAEFLRYKNTRWVLAAMSYLGSRQVTELLRHRQAATRIVLAKVMPRLDANLPVVREARAALGYELDDLSLEGYLAGRMTLHMLRAAWPSTRPDDLLATVRGQRIDIGGLELDFRGDGQGLDEVRVAYLDKTRWRLVSAEHWADWR